MKLAFFAFIFCACTTALGQQASLVMNAPLQPQLFDLIHINTSLSERDFALSPDGMEIFYTLQSPGRNFQTILHIQKEGSDWSAPAVASFAGKYTDLEPAFSPDGKKLFFVSNRPVSGDKPKDYDIWYVEKVAGGWGEPKNIGSPVNTGADEFYPSCTQSGNLYYTAAYRDGVGREDIYMSPWRNGSYQQPVVLDSAVNSPGYEFNAFVSPDEEFIIFSSLGRKGEKGRGDLYMSARNREGQWTAAKSLDVLNSDRLDYCPFVSFDKKILFFTSERHSLPDHYDKPARYSALVESYGSVLNGGGNVYWVDFDYVLKSVY